jgi:hypothetical protein
MKTVIVLMDFYGHPTLNTDTYTDNIRYSALTEIFFKANVNKNECIFFSTALPINAWKLLELKKMATSNGFRFVCPDNNIAAKMIDSMYTIEYVKQQLSMVNFELDNHTQIIIGGTNTSGCVFKSNKGIGAYDWIKAGYKTKIYLPLCAEFEQKGITDFERNQNAYAVLYNNIKKNNVFAIDIIKDFDQLELPF